MSGPPASIGRPAPTGGSVLWATPGSGLRMTLPCCHYPISQMRKSRLGVLSLSQGHTAEVALNGPPGRCLSRAVLLA